nr:MAG TPA: hypothetical protein [Caudoviricetes sp.]
MKFENVRVFNFENAIRGMRNPKNSWDKSDSFFALGTFDYNEGPIRDLVYKWCLSKYPNFEEEDAFTFSQAEDLLDKTEEWLVNNGTLHMNDDFVELALIGPNDMKLMQTLIKAGPEHRKFMRQIFVSVDITAPLYWWKEFDTYKVGTVANSCSTMHKIHAKEFALEDFSHEHLHGPGRCNLEDTIKLLNYYRDCYNGTVVDNRRDGQNGETVQKVFWWQIIQLLPSSYNQKRTVTMSYENLFAMCSKGQRRFHKLNEWSGLDNPELENFIAFARKLPYAQELIFIDETEPEKISISKEIYENLLEIKNKLAALEMGGVDNWEGYSYSLSEFYKNRLEDDE